MEEGAGKGCRENENEEERGGKTEEVEGHRREEGGGRRREPRKSATCCPFPCSPLSCNMLP